MKKFKFSKSLDLNKEVVSKLTEDQANSLIGGIENSDRLCTNTPCATNGCATSACPDPLKTKRVSCPLF